LHDRLQYGAAVLKSLEARRIRTGNPNLHQQVEHKIVSRELEELGKEWNQNVPPSNAAQFRADS
ncbi:MAG: hypothetical protein ACRD4O_11865, partial [Bryobacteraceae bacterium]